MNTYFSIITVSYNSGKTIERTIKSVLAQTYKDFEYIIVDGGSKDNTLEIVKQYEPLFEGKMRWKSEPDRGIYNAMNKGVAMADGSVIGIVNSDDWLESDSLQLVSNSYETDSTPNNSVYCGWIRFHYLDGTSQILKTNHQKFESWAKYYEVAGIRHPAVFVPKSVYQSFGSFDESFKVMSDSDFLLRLFYGGVSFHYIDKVLSNMSDGGVSNRAWGVIFRDYKILLNKYSIKRSRYNFLLLRWKAREYLRNLTPERLLRWYRNYSKA